MQIKVNVGNNVRRQAVIVDSSTTLREVLEQNNVDYTVGMTSLDGCTLHPGDLDKSFDDFGITDKAYLMNVVKADNAACIDITGNVAIVKSGIQLDTIKKLIKYERTSALTIFEGEGDDKEPVFVVGCGTETGSISKYGILFGSTPDVAGNAIAAIIIPDGVSDPKQYVMDVVGTAVLSLNKVEAQIPAAIEALNAELDAISDCISVM